MTLGPFSCFERCHSNGDPIDAWLLAAWHWPWSITWRWSLWWTPWNSRIHASSPFYWRRNNSGGQLLTRIPVIGEFSFTWQSNMRRVDSRNKTP